MTWTDRKHRDLERLLEEFRKELRRRDIGRDQLQLLLEVAEKHSELDFAADLMITDGSGLADCDLGTDGRIGPNILDTVAMFLAILRPEHGKKHGRTTP